MFIKAINKYGKDYEMISNSLKTKTARQVMSKVRYHITSIAANPRQKNTKIAKAVKKIELKASVWTDT